MRDEVARVGLLSVHLSAMMSRSRERCNSIAETERLMGYVDSARIYKEMGSEAAELVLWCVKEEKRIQENEQRNRQASSEDEP